MVTTAILRSQNCLLHPDETFHYEPNPNPQTRSKRPRHRKRNHGPDRTASVARSPAKDLVMGQVKILKRGEELRPPPPPELLVAGPADRLGPDPETVQKQIEAAGSKLYAGSSVIMASPPPSSVPVPGFFARKNLDDSASIDLRRLLRLDHPA